MTQQILPVAFDDIVIFNFHDGFDYTVRYKKSLISKRLQLFDYSVRHKKSLISKRLQFFDYSVCHKKSLISEKQQNIELLGEF